MLARAHIANYTHTLRAASLKRTIGRDQNKRSKSNLAKGRKIKDRIPDFHPRFPQIYRRPYRSAGVRSIDNLGLSNQRYSGDLSNQVITTERRNHDQNTRKTIEKTVKLASKWRQKRRRVVQCVYGQWGGREGTVRHWRRERKGTGRRVRGETAREKRRAGAGGAPPGLWMGTPPLRPVVSSSRSMCLGRRERGRRESV